MILKIPDKYFNDEELDRTPIRYENFLKEWLQDSNDFKFTTFSNPGYNQMIAITNLAFYSMCSHHLVPFFGKAHFAYIPKNIICGLSKIPRVIDKFAHRPQVQEKLTNEIFEYLIEYLKPQWAMLVLGAEHLCMSMRGIKKPGHLTFTNAIYPNPKDHPEFNSAKQEFLEMIKIGEKR